MKWSPTTYIVLYAGRGKMLVSEWHGYIMKHVSYVPIVCVIESVCYLANLSLKKGVVNCHLRSNEVAILQLEVLHLYELVCKF